VSVSASDRTDFDSGAWTLLAKPLNGTGLKMLVFSLIELVLIGLGWHAFRFRGVDVSGEKSGAVGGPVLVGDVTGGTLRLVGVAVLGTNMQRNKTTCK
jgi:hypothetical protein